MAPDRHDQALAPGDAVELAWGGELNRGRVVAVDTMHAEWGQAHVYVELLVKVPSRACTLVEASSRGSEAVRPLPWAGPQSGDPLGMGDGDGSGDNGVIAPEGTVSGHKKGHEISAKSQEAGESVDPGAGETQGNVGTGADFARKGPETGEEGHRTARKTRRAKGRE